MKELSGTKHTAVDLDPLKCNDDQQSKEPQKEDLWLLVYVTSVSVFWHCWIDFVLEWKMRKTNHGEQGSLIRQHCAISNLITKYVTHPWLLFVVNDLIISKSSFLNICELVVQVQSVEAQNIRVLSFNPTCFLSPQIVILSFYPQVSFLLLINRPPSVVLLQRICPSLHLKLFSISAVRNFIVRYFSCWLLFAGQRPHIVWITHSQASNAPP